MSNSLVRTVRFMQRQNAVDLYRCVDNGRLNRVYARLQRDNNTVTWTSTSRWTGGYEPDCPLKANMEIRIVDSIGNLLFTETVSSGEDGLAYHSEKLAPFSWEENKRLAQNYAQQHDLLSYEAWRNKLILSRNLHAPSMDADNWIWVLPITVNTSRETVQDSLGRRLYVECCERKHPVSNQHWFEYLLKQEKYDTLEICGYRWISDN